MVAITPRPNIRIFTLHLVGYDLIWRSSPLFNARWRIPADKPLRADARRKREALLVKAREVFDAGGFFDLRFDDFARLAGVGTGTLYRHFPTREALAEAVYRGEVAALCDRARRLQATLPAAEALATFLRGMVDHIAAHKGLARTLATLMAGRSGVLAEGSRALEQA